MVMHVDRTSLRGKITSAYVVLVMGTMALGVIAFSDLLFLERQIAEDEVVSDLKNAVLEMLREEKILFLKGDDEAFLKADEYAGSSLNIVAGYKVSLSEIMHRFDPHKLVKNLQNYRFKLGLWNNATEDERRRLATEIRTLGRQIYLTIESLSQEERSQLEAAVRESRWFLLISLFIIGLSIYLVGRHLKHVAVTPLKQLESRLSLIAMGDFDHLEPPSMDREFLTFTDAFNRMLKELKVRQKRLLQSEKLASLGILASGVAHELNNPLSNISSSCQLLMEELDEADPEQLHIWLKQIDSETERGRNIVRSLLDFGSQRDFQRLPIKLLDLVQEIQIIMGKALRQYSAKLTVSVAADLTVDVDKQRIQQLFINLIQNALQAMGQGGQLRISARSSDPDASSIPDDAEVAGNLQCIADCPGRVVEISVEDNGPGIPLEHLSRVFDPFYTTSEPGQGVGLGLFIVQEIVREHEGCLAIASRPGKGTQIIVLLPTGDSSHA